MRKFSRPGYHERFRRERAALRIGYPGHRASQGVLYDVPAARIEFRRPHPVGPLEHHLQKTLQEYGLSDKCVGIRSPGLPPDPVNLLGGKEDAVFPQFLKCGQELVEMGAEAICLGSTTMHEAHEFLSQELPVPVINPGPLTYKLVETVLGMGLGHSARPIPSRAISSLISPAP